MKDQNKEIEANENILLTKEQEKIYYENLLYEVMDKISEDDNVITVVDNIPYSFFANYIYKAERQLIDMLGKEYIALALKTENIVYVAIAASDENLLTEKLKDIFLHDTMTNMLQQNYLIAVVKLEDFEKYNNYINEQLA